MTLVSEMARLTRYSANERKAIDAAKRRAIRTLSAEAAHEIELIELLVIRSLQRRILSNVTPVPFCGCWLWLGGASSSGYGVMGCGRSTQVFVHRMSHAIFTGAIPAGYVVCHSCDTPLCCNPAHLFAGTESDNRYDMVNKGRRTYRRNTHCSAGHEYAGENLYVQPSTGVRQCRICKTANRKANYERNGK